MLKNIATAIKELIDTGGRVTEATAEWLDKFLNDELDDAQDKINNFIDKFQDETSDLVTEATSDIRRELKSLNDRIIELEDKLAVATVEKESGNEGS